MLGLLSLPHILILFYTVPDAKAALEDEKLRTYVGIGAE